VSADSDEFPRNSRAKLSLNRSSEFAASPINIVKQMHTFNNVFNFLLICFHFTIFNYELNWCKLTSIWDVFISTCPLLAASKRSGSGLTVAFRFNAETYSQ
jgi:hypothetical protein